MRHSHASLWIKDGGDIITLSKRLGHSTPQVTMTTYADEIEEANDRAARKAHIEAMFGKTKLAALMAATDGDGQQQIAGQQDGKIVRLPKPGDEGQQGAASSG